MKSPAFAAAVSREDLTTGAAELGVEFDEHVAFVIAALGERRDVLMPATTGSAD
jgi:predicted hydrolase (HD superfamily)